MLNILVTGSDGQLGCEIRELAHSFKYNFFFATKDSLDITNKNRVKKFIDENSINAIINCAAYTAVDSAQEDEKNAHLVNTIGIKNLSEISKKNSIKLVHISTDYVFDGKNYRPYIETDMTNPISIYGKTKLDGEKEMISCGLGNSIIIRTSWLYSSFGDNFVKTMLRLGKEKKEISVVFDQIGTPTYARDLALAILEILPNIRDDQTKIYHYSNEGVVSWYDFSKEIMRMAKLGCKVLPILSKDFPKPAPRPHFSVLNKSKIKEDFGIKVPYWKDSLDECLRKMGERK